jgi:hypothetical protein
MPALSQAGVSPHVLHRAGRTAWDAHVPIVSKLRTDTGLIAPTEAELRAFVGRNADYYLERWSWLTGPKRSGAGLNVAALLLGWFWLLYRKLYLAAALIFVTGYLLFAVGMPLSVLCVALGMSLGNSANSLYLDRARKVIARARAQCRPGEDHLAIIARRGGTSLLGAISLSAALSRAIAIAQVVLVQAGWLAGRYGKRLNLNNGQVYYQPPCTEQQARRLGEYLFRSGFLSEKRVTVQLCQVGGTFQFRAALKAGAESNPCLVAAFWALGQCISRDVFDGAPIEVDLCDVQLRTVLVLPWPAPGSVKPVPSPGGTSL